MYILLIIKPLNFLLINFKIALSHIIQSHYITSYNSFIFTWLEVIKSEAHTSLNDVAWNVFYDDDYENLENVFYQNDDHCNQDYQIQIAFFSSDGASRLDN